MKRAEFLMEKDTVFTVGQYSFQTYFPGPGHTADNIVIWFDKEKILYGGCLIKSADAKDLGNLDDADVKAYASTIENVLRKCSHPKYIIPGHDDWRNPQSLNHTLALAKALEKKRSR
jgi:metallo-beta-lactamase class B